MIGLVWKSPSSKLFQEWASLSGRASAIFFSKVFSVCFFKNNRGFIHPDWISFGRVQRKGCVTLSGINNWECCGPDPVTPRMSSGGVADRAYFTVFRGGSGQRWPSVPISKNLSGLISKNPFLGRVIISGRTVDDWWMQVRSHGGFHMNTWMTLQIHPLPKTPLALSCRYVI